MGAADAARGCARRRQRRRRRGRGGQVGVGLGGGGLKQGGRGGAGSRAGQRSMQRCYIARHGCGQAGGCRRRKLAGARYRSWSRGAGRGDGLRAFWSGCQPPVTSRRSERLTARPTGTQRTLSACQPGGGAGKRGVWRKAALGSGR